MKFISILLVICLTFLSLGCLGSDEVVVTKIIDGDTIWVRKGLQEFKVRYIGIDTPEITFGKNEPFGQEAKEKNEELLSGGNVTLEYDVQKKDQYGRVLAYVWVGDLMVNSELVRLGYATVATYPPNVKYVSLFLQMQREAKGAKRGLWS